MSPAARQKRFDALLRVGCVACRTLGYISQAEIHHLNLDGHAGQKRLGDEYTVPLCPMHHRGHWSDRFATLAKAQTLLGPSLALEPKRFRERFGSDDELLAQANALIEAA